MGKALTVEEVAEYLGLAKDTVYRKAKSGEIPGARIGRSWRFPQDVIDEWLREKAGVKRVGQEAKVKKGKKLPPGELRRRQRIVKDILRLRKYFEKLPITADQAYKISRRQLEQRPLRWK